MLLDEKLEEVEELGFDRETFPLYYNGHHIWLLQNDARITVDERLQVHFTLYCVQCDRENTVRGRAPPVERFSERYLQDIKVLAMRPFVHSSC